MRPWQIAVPPILYKYVRPERLDVLAKRRVRFSQRTAFEDERVLKPEVAAFGTEEEIRDYIPQVKFMNGAPQQFIDTVVRAIVNDAAMQRHVAAICPRQHEKPGRVRSSLPHGGCRLR